MLVKVKFLLSLVVIFLPVGLCAAESFSVSGGGFSAPYFTFTDSDSQTPDFTTQPLYRGETYEFNATGVSGSHPFMIGESYGDTSSSLVSGGPLTGSSGTITVTIPSDFNGSLYYFCTNHSSMIQEFTITTPNHVVESFSVSGGGFSAPYFTFTDSDSQTPDFTTQPLYRGETYEFNASGVSTSHPFMIGESYGDTSSSLVSGGPLTGSSGTITVTIPSDFNGSLYYFCTNHSSMIQEFTITTPNHVVESFSVSGGDFSAPYFTFIDSDSQTPDFTTQPLYRGETYEFNATGVSGSHPFMIGESYGDTSSSLVSGGPLTGSSGTITVTIPSDFNGSLYYFCTNHSSMIQEFTITTPNHVVDLNSTVNLEMIWVEPGTFTMGSPESETGRGTNETEHNVTLSKGFYLGKYEVTQAQYEAVMTGNTETDSNGNVISATPSQFGVTQTVPWRRYPGMIFRYSLPV